jgi:hypothetical protein
MELNYNSLDDCIVHRSRQVSPAAGLTKNAGSLTNVLWTQTLAAFSGNLENSQNSLFELRHSVLSQGEGAWALYHYEISLIRSRASSA